MQSDHALLKDNSGQISDNFRLNLNYHEFLQNFQNTTVLKMVLKFLLGSDIL